jgi:hypothetical protein
MQPSRHVGLFGYNELKPPYDLVCTVGHGVDDIQSMYREDVADGSIVTGIPIKGILHLSSYQCISAHLMNPRAYLRQRDVHASVQTS